MSLRGVCFDDGRPARFRESRYNETEREFLREKYGLLIGQFVYESDDPDGLSVIGLIDRFDFYEDGSIFVVSADRNRGWNLIAKPSALNSWLGFRPNMEPVTVYCHFRFLDLGTLLHVTSSSSCFRGFSRRLLTVLETFISRFDLVPTSEPIPLIHWFCKTGAELSEQQLHAHLFSSLM